MLNKLARLQNATTARYSSWDTGGRNRDCWTFAPGESRVLADIQGPGVIRHLWMTSSNHFRQCLLKMTWDGAKHPSSR